MRLATPEDVVTAVGTQSTPALLSRASAALDSSYSIIESILETTLVAQERVDYFTVSASFRFPKTFRLTNRFVDTDSVKVYSQPQISSLAALDDTYLLDPASYTVDRRDGTVTVLSTNGYTGNGSLAVRYKSGSAESGGVVPSEDWVKAMAITAAVMEININPTSTANRKDKTVQSVAGVVSAYLHAQGENYRRPRMWVEWPQYSVIYD